MVMNNSEINNIFFIFIYDLANTILVILLPQLGHTMSYPAEPLRNLMSLYQFHSRSSFLHPHLSQSCILFGVSLFILSFRAVSSIIFNASIFSSPLFPLSLFPFVHPTTFCTCMWRDRNPFHQDIFLCIF